MTAKKTARIAARVPPELREELERAAEERRWSLSTAVEVACEKWIESRGGSPHFEDNGGRREGEAA